MSDIDSAFFRPAEAAAHSSSIEKRVILSAPRKTVGGGRKSKAVEVVHIRRNGALAQPRPTPRPAWNVRAETWPEGFRAQSPAPPPQQAEPAARPEPTPVVHVRAGWEPAASPPTSLAATPAEFRLGGKPRPSRYPAAKGEKAPARRFADPFAENDSGANCIRCGYLIEPARELRHLMTCSRCG